MQRLLKNRKDGITLPALLQKEDFKIIKIKEKKLIYDSNCKENETK